MIWVLSGQEIQYIYTLKIEESAVPFMLGNIAMISLLMAIAVFNNSVLRIFAWYVKSVLGKV